MDFSFEVLVMGGHSVHPREESESASGLARNRRLVTIDMLPDDVLVEIFYFSQRIVDPVWYGDNTWHALVHVCRRWRYLVFASPRHLNLRLEYRGRRPMSEVLDAWPVLPISVINIDRKADQRWHNTVAALQSEHSSRICEIYIRMTNSCWERFAAAMQKPFPELTHLQVWADDTVPVLPESFLGGSAPSLRSLSLESVPFPSIPKLLSFAHGLVALVLWLIPDSGYFSPDTMATALAVMTSLESLDLQFHAPRSRPNPTSQLLPPPTRSVLPALTELMFEGVYEYLEDLLAQIDAPLLCGLYIEFVKDLDFDVPQLHRFIGHTEEFKTFDRAEISISNLSIKLHLYPSTVQVNDRRRLQLQINDGELDHKLLSLTQVCSSSFRLISALEELRISEGDNLRLSHWKDDMVNPRWLELLHPFTALKNLYLTHEIAQRICYALQEFSGEREAEVLPTLRNLFVQGFSSLEPVQEALMPFVAAQELSGHPVVIDHWKY